ncbi:DUF6959 family protein [Streptomyces sp. NPDC102270]|uniref:DUF6959 family protein n=1 Tax=Streptomyces sp. NPDC102270 TaxID=3366150 RepID=UPI00381E0F86
MQQALSSSSVCAYGRPARAVCPGPIRTRNGPRPAEPAPETAGDGPEGGATRVFGVRPRPASGGNNAVVRLPGRRFPGILVQGDSLHILRTEVAEIAEACERGDLAEARDSAGLLLSGLDDLLAACEAALADHGIRRPY